MTLCIFILLYLRQLSSLYLFYIHVLMFVLLLRGFVSVLKGAIHILSKIKSLKTKLIILRTVWTYSILLTVNHAHTAGYCPLNI